MENRRIHQKPVIVVGLRDYENENSIAELFFIIPQILSALETVSGFRSEIGRLIFF